MDDVDDKAIRGLLDAGHNPLSANVSETVPPWSSF
jgi:hypothetical protein